MSSVQYTICLYYLLHREAVDGITIFDSMYVCMDVPVNYMCAVITETFIDCSQMYITQLTLIFPRTIR